MKPDLATVVPRLIKPDRSAPALTIINGDIAVRAGVEFGGTSLHVDHVVDPPNGGYLPGCDYAVIMQDEELFVRILHAAPTDEAILGGFHFAPGGNASARSGGDDVAQINPCSLWDIAFRPTCNPRGMTLVSPPDRPRFWCDIYLLAADHLALGTSSFGATIADGDDPPGRQGGGPYDKLDYETALAVMAHHGKGLLSPEEFFAAAIGVTEKTAASGNPRRTGLDPPRTSRFGLMQATGNMWAWGHDGDPDAPRASLFGGSWHNGGSAGSRYANVAYAWPDGSGDGIGARGRGDHLQPA